MGIPKRSNRYLGLKDLEVLVEDTQSDSKYFNVPISTFPDILSQGKSRFLIGGSDYLRHNPPVRLKIELIHDATSEVIYTEPVKEKQYGTLRAVSIEVYNNTPAGPATLYIVGELDPTTSDVPVPSEWQGIYNVRWKRSLTIDLEASNSQPIYFYKQPSMEVSEIFRGFVDTVTSSVQTAYLTASFGDPRIGFTGYIPSVEGTDSSWFARSTFPKKDFADKAKLSIIEENKLTTKLSGKTGLIGSKGKLLQISSPVEPDYNIHLTSSSISLDSSYIGHTFTFNNPQIDTEIFDVTGDMYVPTVYSSSIMVVKNSTKFVPKDPFLIKDYSSGYDPYKLIPAPLKSQFFTASYQNLPTQSTSSVNYFSYADIRLTDLRTFSGDVYKATIKAESEGSLGDFELVYDLPAESEEILYDNNNPIGLGRLGYFDNQNKINDYWEIFEGVGGNTSGTGTLTKDDVFLIDAMKISGSNMKVNDELRVQLKSPVNFTAGIPYTFKAKLFGIKTFKENSSDL